MHFVSALDSVGGMRAVLGLHETVCSGAAGAAQGHVPSGIWGLQREQRMHAAQPRPTAP